MNGELKKLLIELEVLDATGKVLHVKHIAPEDYFYSPDEPLPGDEIVFSEPHTSFPRKLYDDLSAFNYFRVTVRAPHLHLELVEEFSYWDSNAGVMHTCRLLKAGAEVIAERQMIISQDLKIDGEEHYMVQRFLWAPVNWIPQSMGIFRKSDDSMRSEICAFRRGFFDSTA